VSRALVLVLLLVLIYKTLEVLASIWWATGS
jgi:hypothetical protein